MIRVELLAHHTHLISTIAKWHWDEWGHLDPGGSIESWTDGLNMRANEDEIPLTIIALDGDKPVGSASLVKFDMDTRRDLTPWLAGVFVLPEYRGQGIARQLLQEVMIKAKSLGIQKLYLYTRSAIGLYEKLGWKEMGDEDYEGRLVKIMYVDLSSNPTFLDPKQVVERGYDKVARAYARLEGESAWPRMRWLKKILERLEPGALVLDLGCGSGDPADIAISKHHQVTGVDISQAQIILAQENVPSGTFIHGDAGSVEFSAASFDAVVSFYTIEHIPRTEHGVIFRRIHAWLKVGGLLLVSTEAGKFDDVMAEWLGVPMFISSFGSEATIDLVQEAGFEILENAVETQREQNIDIPYLWIFARKS